MNDRLDCHDMEMLCRQRAKVDPKHNWKWLEEADKWRELEHREIAWRFQQRNFQQQMHAGPMAIGPNTIYGDSRSKQPQKPGCNAAQSGAITLISPIVA